jgi:sugar/nucleoside kinase (ribokinase family)
VTVDVVCAGPPFLDLVFRGLPRMPVAGEEIVASDVSIVPGAMANVAFALRQLDLEAVVCAPVGGDPAGRLLQSLMAEAGIPWVGAPTSETPISVAIPIDGERAFVTHFPTPNIDVAAIAPHDPRAVVVNLPLPDGLSGGPRLIGVLGDPQVAIIRERPVESWAELRAVVMNEREATQLSGRSNAADAARDLASRGCLVIVTRGDRGVVAVEPGGECREAPGTQLEVVDTLGAGDLFTAAWLWADLADRPLEESLAVAARYTAESLAAPGPRQKGLSRTAFLAIVDDPAEPRSWMREVRG